MSSRRENPASRNIRTKNNSHRPIPRSASKSRFIIRTRSQASQATRAPPREPLRDAPTNSPSQETLPAAADNEMHGSGTLLPPQRKRPPSPSFDVEDGAPQGSKKAKMYQSPSKSPAKQHGQNGGPSNAASTSQQPQQNDENMYKTPFQTRRSSTAPVPTVDLYNPPLSPTRARPKSPSKPFTFDLLGPPPDAPGKGKERRWSADGLQPDGSECSNQKAPLPALPLFAKSALPEEGQTPAPSASTSSFTVPTSTMSDDENENADDPMDISPTKKSSTIPRKSSMIPRPVRQLSTFKFKGPTLKPPPRAKSNGTNKNNTNNKMRPSDSGSLDAYFIKPPPTLSTPSSSTAKSIVQPKNRQSLAPVKRPAPAPWVTHPTASGSGSTSTSISEPVRAPSEPHPPRPSTSLGFNDPKRRSTMAASTQTSLSNLSSAMEQLSIPRARMSLAASMASISGSLKRSATVSGVGVNDGPAGKRPGRTSTIGVGNSASALSRSVGGGRPSTSLGIGLGRPSSALGPHGRASLAPNLGNRPRPLGTTPSSVSMPPPAGIPGTNRRVSGYMANGSFTHPSTSATDATGGNGNASTGPSTSTSTSTSSAGSSTSTVVVPVPKKIVTEKKSNVLKDCVIYVDVKTEDGQDAGELFIDMLKGLGARILTRPTPSITHIVFKSGSPTTLAKHKLYNDPKPFLVGIGWVVESVEKRVRAEESKFVVNEADVPVWGKRRKSMQPKMIKALSISAGLLAEEERNPTISSPPVSDHSFAESSTSTPTGDSFDGETTLVSSSPPVHEDSLPPLERARRKSHMFAPKVSSPLKTAFKLFDDDDEDDAL